MNTKQMNEDEAETVKWEREKEDINQAKEDEKKTEKWEEEKGKGQESCSRI